MSKSLQDQLLALGLASEKPKKTRKPSARAQGKISERSGRGISQKKGPGQGKSFAGEVSLHRAYALRKKEEKKQAGEPGAGLIPLQRN